MPIRTRIAPSPTGRLHLGTARTALFNYLFAKQKKGKFVLRIEDTDKQRGHKKFEADIIRHLNWLGLTPDEGPYRQSERGKIYQKYLKQLLEQGSAFWCWHTKKELEREQEQAQQRKKPPVHWCEYKNQKSKIKNQNERGIIRFATPRNQPVRFEDKIRGEVRVSTETIGDFSIAKNLKTPLYNFAVVIDDHLMKITDVIRGEDHLSNTPKQILLYQALNWQEPTFAHLPLILSPDKTKLSKRHGAVAISEYKKQGYLPEALINFMVLLGWHPADNREYFTLEQLIKEFSLKRVKKGGAIFNLAKLNDINRYYLKSLSPEAFARRALPFVKKYIKKEYDNDDYDNDAYRIAGFKELQPWSKVVQILSLEKQRISTLSDIAAHLNFIWNSKITYPSALLIWKNTPPAVIKQNLKILKEAVEKIDAAKFSAENLKKRLMPLAKKQDDLGRALWPLRAALTGQSASPGPFEVAEVLGKKRTLSRLKKAIDKL